MGKVEIRPGVWMAYEDHWFGEPWAVPETVVMIHGNSESSRAWTCWVPHLARHYRVVRPDLPGFGASPEPAGYGWSAEELAADIGRFLDALNIEHDNGLITAEEVAAPDKAKLEEAVRTLNTQYPEDAVRLYLHTLVLLDGDTWSDLGGLLENGA